MPKRVETMQLTTDMLLGLMQGKDVCLVLNASDEDKRIEFRFKGPFDGVFLTHAEIQNIKYNSEMGIMNVMERLRKSNMEEYNVKSEKG